MDEGAEGKPKIAFKGNSKGDHSDIERQTKGAGGHQKGMERAARKGDGHNQGGSGSEISKGPQRSENVRTHTNK